MATNQQPPITNFMTPQATKRPAEDVIEYMDDEMTSAEELRNPRKTRRFLNNQKHLQQKQRQSINDANRYGTLNDNDEEIDTNSIRFTKPRSFPPITITHNLTNVKGTYSIIKSWVEKVHFKSNEKGQHQVLTYSDDDFKLIQKKLKSSNIEFFTFTPHTERTKKLILKGINEEYTIDEVMTDLKKQCSNFHMLLFNVATCPLSKWDILTPFSQYYS